jgi:hypothetical protein
MYAMVDLFALASTEISASEVQDIAERDKHVAAVIRPGAIVAIMTRPKIPIRDSTVYGRP